MWFPPPRSHAVRTPPPAIPRLQVLPGSGLPVTIWLLISPSALAPNCTGPAYLLAQIDDSSDPLFMRLRRMVACAFCPMFMRVSAMAYCGAAIYAVPDYVAMPERTGTEE